MRNYICRPSELRNINPIPKCSEASSTQDPSAVKQAKRKQKEMTEKSKSICAAILNFVSLGCPCLFHSLPMVTVMMEEQIELLVMCNFLGDQVMFKLESFITRLRFTIIINTLEVLAKTSIPNY
jgi:hypothetical protein